MAKNQKTDKDGFAVLQTTERTKYITIDHWRDGKAKVKTPPAAERLTDFAKAIINAAKEKENK